MLMVTRIKYCNTTISVHHKDQKKNPAVLPGRHVLYPGMHREAVGSRDYCLEPGSSVLLHEKPSKEK